MPNDHEELAAGEQVESGTVTAGVEFGCLLLNGYQLIGGPREMLQPGVQVRVTGRPEPRMMTIAQQGTPFVVTGAEPLS